MGIKQWNLPEPDGERTERLAEETGLSSLLCRILLARGYSGSSQIEKLLSPETALSSPFLLADMDKAVERIRLAVENGERIAVYGDYDCDGITSTALLTGYLQSVGADVIFYVPQREQEGYGMNLDAVEFLGQQNVTLIITVDNGVSSHREIDRAGELGIDVVVTDHHTPRETLPDAVAVLNPHRGDCPSGLTELAGVGVAFKLVCALEGDETGDEMLEYYSDLVTLGTVADVVPLTGENRVMVRHGLELLRQSHRAGVNALIERCCGERAITSESLAFTLAPRLNAAGRMGSADNAIELLLTDDVRYSRDIAAEIDGQNTQRKEIEEQITKEITDALHQSPQLLRERLIVVAGEGWHHGVVGIVASKILEMTGKPALLFSLDGEYARGSARSLPGFSIIQAISACKDHLTQFGGHAMAAGMTLPREKLPQFTAQLQQYARTQFPHMPVQSVEVDCVLAPEELTVESIASVSLLEPFGAGNRQPVYLLPELRLEKILPTADEKHIRLQFAWGNSAVTAIYFRMRERDFPYRPGDRVDVVAGVSLNTYNGKTGLSVVVRDIRKSGICQKDLVEDKSSYDCYLREEYDALEDTKALLPDRDEIALVYRYLRRGPFLYPAEELYYRLADKGLSYGKVMVALDVLEELKLTGREARAIVCRPNPDKVDLDSSGILQKLRELALQKVR